jgi:hypothetical protein
MTLRPGTELFVNGNRESSERTISSHGIDNNDRLTLAIIVRPAVEAIKPFTIQTNPFSAEQGETSGGQVNAADQVRCSNDLHGHCFHEFLAQSGTRRQQLLRIVPARPAALFARTSLAGRLGGRLLQATKPSSLATTTASARTSGRLFGRSHYGSDPEDAPGRLQRDRRRHLRSGNDGAERDNLHRASRLRTMSTPRERWDPVTAKLINAYPRPTTAGLANKLVTTPAAQAELGPV